MPPSEPISRGVEMGYRVMDEYMHEGQNVARALWPPYLGGAMPHEELPRRIGAMVQSFSDFASLWLEMMERFGAGRPPMQAPGGTPASGTAGPFSAGCEPEPRVASGAVSSQAASAGREADAATLLGFSLDIQSTRRIELSIDLRPQSASLPLRVLDLRSPEPDKPRLTGIAIEGFPAEDRVLLRIHIQDSQPAGNYSGVIIDERTSLPRGTLAVRILPSDGSP
ncbi:hypothetical protein [Stigmatella aurantiaca]|uniref:hypothetical protein n=1 Tax=Stigmatella aurantiaca TaxID=41 RepID=UPI0009422891|nr:hypothetical protein [Stigmatella aurantiaca]